MLIDYSTNARGYTLVALFTLLILTLGTIVRKQKNNLAWMLISLFSALGFYTIPVMLFPFGILFVWLFLENLFGGVVTSCQANSTDAYHSKLEFLKYWGAVGFASAILTLLFYTQILIFTGPVKVFANNFVAPLPLAHFMLTLSQRLSESWDTWEFRVPLAVIILLAVGLILSLVFHKWLATIRFPLQVAALLWISTLLILQRPNALAKVWLFLLPLVLVWAAAGIVSLLVKIRLKFLRNLPLAVVVVGMVLLSG
jgi:hypothetical protein